jgi:hypothetical protein
MRWYNRRWCWVLLYDETSPAACPGGDYSGDLSFIYASGVRHANDDNSAGELSV